MPTNWLVGELLVLGLSVVFCGAILSTNPGQVDAAMEGMEIIQAGGELGWATALPDGRLMTWFIEEGEGGEQGEVPPKAFARYSSDNGRTWSEPVFLFELPVAEGSFITDDMGVVVPDRQGNLHLFGLHSHEWSWEKFAGRCRPWHSMSADGGQTWTPLQYCDAGYNYSGLQSAFELSSGRLILTTWFASETIHGRWGTRLVISDDAGRTWRPAAEKILEEDVSLDEAAGCQLTDGRLWLVFRPDPESYLYEAYSADGGDTWSEPQPTQFVSPSAPAAVLRLADDRILMVWNNSLKPKHVFNRLVLAAAISEDGGETWHGYREIARTTGVPGPEGWVCYPWITQSSDGTVIVSYRMQRRKPVMAQLDPAWLMETSFHDDFSAGLDNWITMQTEGPQLATHPDDATRQILALRKPDPEVASGASLNFPFGPKGELTMRVRLEPGFQGMRLTLTDHFTWPEYAEEGQFTVSIWGSGEIAEPLPAGEAISSGVKLESGKWYELKFAWNTDKDSCALSVDGEHVTDLAQLSPGAGVCYLRLWSSASETDEAGLLVDSVDVDVAQ